MALLRKLYRDKYPSFLGYKAASFGTQKTDYRVFCVHIAGMFGILPEKC
jgi:hypothetical protein